ncbi:MAG: hypothetical protein ACLT98_03500 [Eggerthellaceae bacterium]
MRRRTIEGHAAAARVPLGVVAMVYEARLNVTADAAESVSAGNACVLRGGSQASYPNIALTKVLRDAVQKAAFLPIASAP